MKIPKEMIGNQVQHRYAGNGWAAVDAHEGEWIDITAVGNEEVGDRFFRVWSKCLKVDYNKPIHRKLIDKITDLQEKLASGELKVVNTRLVKT